MILNIKETEPKLLLFIAFHVILWTVLPFIFHPNMPLDMTELVSWGHGWQLGYYKHPPLSSWIAEGAMMLTNNSIAAYYLLSQIAIGTSFYFLWRLGQEFLSHDKAFYAVLLIEGIYYYNFTSPEFNPNVLMLPLWAGLILTFWHGLQSPTLWRWILVGILAALSILSKYYSLVLLTSLFLSLIFIQDFRWVWRSKYPYIAFLICMLCLTPHIIWIFESDFLTFKYIAGRSASSYAWYKHIIHPLKFTLSQFLACLGTLLIFGYIFRGNIRKLSPVNSEATFLFFAGLMPFCITLLISVLTAIKLRSMWGTPLWGLLPIMLFYFFAPTQITFAQRKKIFISTACLIALSTTAYIANFTFGHHKRAHFQGEKAAHIISREWERIYPNQPLEIVVGNLWLGGNIGFYAPERLRVFIDYDEAKSPWVSKKDLSEKGGVIVWKGKKDLPPNIAQNHADYIIQPALTLPWNNMKNKDSFILGWAIIPPKSSGEPHL